MCRSRAGTRKFRPIAPPNSISLLPTNASPAPHRAAGGVPEIAPVTSVHLRDAISKTKTSEVSTESHRQPPKVNSLPLRPASAMSLRTIGVPCLPIELSSCAHERLAGVNSNTSMYAELNPCTPYPPQTYIRSSITSVPIPHSVSGTAPDSTPVISLHVFVETVYSNMSAAPVLPDVVPPAIVVAEPLNT
eukprot:3027287-Rhodomonas_salina.2